jgi:ABC-type multidrug transport system fused ATPase/permease subunit
MVIASRFFSKDLKRLSWAQYESSANMTKGVQDSLMGIEAVKSFGAENREVSKFHHSLKILRKVGLRRLILMTLFSESFSLIAACAGFFILWLSGQLIISKKFTLGGYLAFSAYFGQLFAPTQTVANLNMLLQPAKVALLRIREMQLIRQEEPRTVDCATFSLQGGIEFNGVGFGYYPERQILDDIYMDIKPGEKVMIIGANGSGKSTLLKLIMGFYYPQKGLIKFDGIRQEDIPIAALRNRISIVSQNTFLFSDTIRNNILFGAPNASPQEFERIVVETGILDFAMKLPDGIDTEVGERGVRLSGGEKQRISIARALIKKSDIYIFDEAATHLDKLTCPLISNIISLRLKRNTCIVICHQPIDDLKIDRFLYLVDGKIEEEHSSGREDMPAIEESL